jgi:endoglucanase
MKLLIFKLLLVVLVFSPTLKAQQCSPWQQWHTFKSHFISKDGRVIDLGSKQQITTSEGQSYALFFALVANDKVTFDRVLNWTQTHLAEGDLSTRLPAWQWGINNDNTAGILDSTPASDSDLWIAYSLSQAALLWGERRYSVLAAVLAQRIMREETAYIPGLGLSLLPGPRGFEFADARFKLNPSYSPLFIYQQFSQLYPHSPWQQLHDNSAELLIATSPHGVSPDWVMYDANSGFYFDKNTSDLGSYNAIRVYLWAAMMADNAPYKKQLITQFSPFINSVQQRGYVPLNSYAKTGKVDNNKGPAGFQAALLPLLATQGHNETQMAIQQQLMVDNSFRQTRYYDSVLNLFANGSISKRFTMSINGTLQPAWSTECR